MVEEKTHEFPVLLTKAEVLEHCCKVLNDLALAILIGKLAGTHPMPADLAAAPHVKALMAGLVDAELQERVVREVIKDLRALALEERLHAARRN